MSNLMRREMKKLVELVLLIVITSLIYLNFYPKADPLWVLGQMGIGALIGTILVEGYKYLRKWLKNRYYLKLIEGLPGSYFQLAVFIATKKQAIEIKELYYSAPSRVPSRFVMKRRWNGKYKITIVYAVK